MYIMAWGPEGSASWANIRPEWVEAPIEFFHEDIDRLWPAAPHRPRGLSLAEADAPLVEEMRGMVARGDVPSPTQAAQRVVSRAVGGGTAESKVRRLVNRYNQSASA